MSFISGCKLIGGGLATMSILGSGIGVGLVFAALVIATALDVDGRNQALIFRYAILGFALTEAIALFGLMMAFLIMYL